MELLHNVWTPRFPHVGLPGVYIYILQLNVFVIFITFPTRVHIAQKGKSAKIVRKQTLFIFLIMRRLCFVFF